MVKKRINLFGPGFLVTAAFIGPGTIATASMAGSGFGYALVWAVVFSVLATIILQEMTARLGIVTQGGLGSSLRTTFKIPVIRNSVCILVATGILFGNAAYQAGNITGAAKGLSEIMGLSFQFWAIPIAILAWLLLMSGQYKLIQNLLIALVVVMSGLFLISAIAIGPDWLAALRGAVMPAIPAESLLLVIALIGTTVVPYNLFLHSSSVAKYWKDEDDKELSLASSRIDIVASVVIGGMITVAILVSAAVAFGGDEQTKSISRVAEQLQPVLGSASKWVFGIGLFAAGLTSAITAPLAAAYATSGCMGWDSKISSVKFRFVFSIVILLGLAACLVFESGTSPTQVIIVAQFANGLLLPLIALFLLVVMNNRKLLGSQSNGVFQNILGVTIVLITAGLGAFQFYKAISSISDLLKTSQ